MNDLHLAGLSVEMTMLAIATVFGLFQLLIAARTNNSQRGLAWNLSPRDGETPPSGKIAGRLERAWRNFIETFAFFVAAILACTVLGRHGWTTLWGSELYVAARILYLPCYAFGITGVRTAVWLVALIGLSLVIAGLFGAGT